MVFDDYVAEPHVVGGTCHTAGCVHVCDPSAGRGIGLVGAGAILAFGWCPSGSESSSGSHSVGLVLSSAWPLFNPFRAVLAAGNPQWQGPPNLHSPRLLAISIFPSIFGIFGLIRPVVPQTRWVFLAAFSLYLAAFLLGFFGVMVASRFLMPLILVLHIGLGSMIIRLFRGEIVKSPRSRMAVAAFAWLCIATPSLH